MKLVALRDHIGKTLNRFATDYSMVVIDSDLAKSTTTSVFEKEHPLNFMECGIAEQSSMSIAQGVASEGFIPFYVNFAMFVTGTAWTQLRQICYSNSNVKIIGTHPGMDNGPDGATHHANEDFALTRSLPNLEVLVPGNLYELESSIEYAIKKDGPVYIRVARDLVLDDEECSTPFVSGQHYVVDDKGNDITIVYEGTTSELAYSSYVELLDKGYKAKLINIRYIKPLDKASLAKDIKFSKIIVSIENHSIVGGLATLVSEIMVENEIFAKLVKIGVEDVFTESGKTSEVKKKYGLSTTNVLSKVESIYTVED